jgi:hypothetical protein
LVPTGTDLVEFLVPAVVIPKKDYITEKDAKKVSTYARWYSLLRVNFTLNSHILLL